MDFLLLHLLLLTGGQRRRRRSEHGHFAPPPFQRRIERVRQPRAHALADDEPVHHHFDHMFVALRQPDRLGPRQFDDLAIHPHPHEALALQFLNYVAKFSDFALHHRREQDDPTFRGIRLDLVGDLLRREFENGRARGRIVRLSHRGKEQPQVVVDLRRGGDGRARISARAALLDGDGRRQSFNKIHVRFLHLVQKLPCIGGQALDVAPLALRVERIKSQ